MNTNQGILLSTDLGLPTSIPYFLWDEPMTTAEFRHRLSATSAPEQTRLLAKLLRQARDTDAWHFTTPAGQSSLLYCENCIDGRVGMQGG